MTSEVATLSPDVPVPEAADLLAEGGYGAMPVVDDEGRLVGLLRDEDLIMTEARIHVPTIINLIGLAIPLPGEQKHMEEEIRRYAGATVGDIMQTDPATIGPDATVEDLATAMHDSDVTHLPVVDDDGRVVGIVARGDLIRFIARTT